MTFHRWQYWVMVQRKRKPALCLTLFIRQLWQGKQVNLEPDLHTTTKFFNDSIRPFKVENQVWFLFCRYYFTIEFFGPMAFLKPIRCVDFPTHNRHLQKHARKKETCLKRRHPTQRVTRAGLTRFRLSSTHLYVSFEKTRDRKKKGDSN